MDKKVFKLFEPGVRLLFFALMLFVVASSFIDFYLFVGELIIFILVYFYYRNTTKLRKKDIAKYIDNLTYNVDSVSKKSILNFPLPMVLIRANGEISWYNERFNDMLESIRENYFEKQITKIFPFLEMDTVLNSEGDEPAAHLVFNKRNYAVYTSYIKENYEDDNVSLIALYFIDETELCIAKKDIEDHKSVVAIVLIDNYEEVILQENDVEKANITATIDKIMGTWAKKQGAIIQRFARDRYLVLMEQQYYRQLTKDKYSILEDVKEVVVGESKIPVTISIGIGVESYSFVQKYEYARAAIEIALGRGGDQVVIKSADKYEYYGGKSKELEKRTKVKSRVVSTALKELIRGSDNIYIMGHKYSDMDAVGAAIGVASIAKNYGKFPKIVVNTRSITVDRAIKIMEKSEKYKDVFISITNNLPIVTEKTLLIVVDTHSSLFVESYDLLKAAGKVVIIDHHRRGENFIENATLYYHEPYASSTSEMVAEIAGYLDKDGKINKDEANALMSGIILDTKGFTVKTGVRTFEAASYLKRMGGDTVEAKQIFRNNLDDYKAKINFISCAEFIGNIAICAANDTHTQLTKELFSSAVDDLMAVEGVQAVFGIAKFGEKVHISARSYGKINVQMIMEKLGGGGHQTMAGIQLKDITVLEARETLLSAIGVEKDIEKEIAEGKI